MMIIRLSKWAFMAALVFALNAFADSPAVDSDADKAWKEVQTALRPEPPKEWKTKEPTEAEQKAFAGPAFLKAADLAREFYTKYPKDKRAEQAKFYEMRALNMAERAGVTNALARLKKAEKAQMDDPNASPESRFGVRFSEIQREATAKGEPGSAGFNDSFEKGLQQLEKEFPKRTEVQDLKLQLASLSEPAKAKQLAEEVLKSDAGPQAKETAKTLIAKMERVGKPVDISFKAVDGRDVDLAKLKGKVVLVDFWATWCGPCVAELPHVKAAYADLHPKGFEVVGISLDSDKSRLTKFVADQKMAWPQYFDGKQWQNEISTKYGIQSIPAMWLIDKKGNLRDINARGDLKGKIEKLLAEK